MTLKEIRKCNSLSQAQAAELLGISRRSYVSYENDESKRNTSKYLNLCERLAQHALIDEEHGLQTLERIKEVCKRVFDKIHVDYCYLFGSYAKGKATETSDVDLLISTSVTGLSYFGLVETLRESLGKKVDLIPLADLSDLTLIHEVLQDGVKIYG